MLEIQQHMSSPMKKSYPTSLVRLRPREQRVSEPMIRAQRDPPPEQSRKGRSRAQLTISSDIPDRRESIIGFWRRADVPP